ncbi:hypothetical protein BHU09_07125 [Tannerella sp. oral taxon 808]|nr:hypothetical protein BHU09_07125 [Tannerella sp. oral taxon 808]
MELKTKNEKLKMGASLPVGVIGRMRYAPTAGDGTKNEKLKTKNGGFPAGDRAYAIRPYEGEAR